MDSEDVFIAILATLGFTAENMRNEIILEGVTTCNDLSSLTGPELEQVYAEARNRNRRRNLNQQITLSIPARSRLEAFRYKLYLRETCASIETLRNISIESGC
jgi:hypothetical protein